MMNWSLILLILAAVSAEGSTDENCETFEPVDQGSDDTYCQDIPQTCEDSKYRSADGSCNNLQHSWWGTALTPYSRHLCNSDLLGVAAIYNKDLPNPREISLRFFVDLNVEDKLWTLLFMQYGQIVAHDLSLTAGVAQTKKDAITCCTEDGQPKPEDTRNPRCAPIPIPENDPYNSIEGITCMDFFRVETTQDDMNCTNAPELPQPLSAVTSYLDVSYLYGNDKDTAMKVREGKGGRLAYVMRKGKMFLPQDPDPELTCNVETPTEPCYFTGDVRVNQNPELALEHNIYLAHHNLIAAKLAKVNPHWDDETLFQETRRIVIAIHQNIIYYEFLPGLLGENYTIEHKLRYPNAEGYINDYNSLVNAGVANEFSACAFRLFHTEIMGILKSVKENRNISDDVIRLSDWFDRPSITEKGNNYDGFMRGMATQPQSAVDRYMPNDILNQLFKTGLLGLDLKAIDIQRGRDQRVCPCAKTLRALNMSDPQSFDDFEKIITKEKVAALRDLYKSYEDIDLCTCIFLEERLPGLLVGPLALSILGEQFYRSRVGDRYFFENGQGKHPFTLEQLKVIRKSTLAEIFCYNKDIKEMQPQILKLISENNPLMPCKNIPKFNALPWKEFKVKKNN